MHWFQRRMLRNSTEDSSLEDDVPLADKYPNKCVTVVEEGYQDGQKYLRRIHSKEKSKNGILSPAKMAENRHISSDLVIFENYFGKFRSIWNAIESKYKDSKPFTIFFLFIPQNDSFLFAL